MNRIIKELKDIKAGLLILCSKEFWKDFLDYYSAEKIAERLEKLAKELKK